MIKFLWEVLKYAPVVAIPLTGCTITEAPQPTTAPPDIVLPTQTLEIKSPALVLVSAPSQVGNAVVPPTASDDNVIIRTYYGTNRKATGSATPSEAFSTEEAGVSYGVADVSIPKEHRLGHLEGPIIDTRYLKNPSKHVLLMGIRPLEKDVLLTLIRQEVEKSQGKSALVFIHGYNVSFEDAARRTAQLSYDLGFEGPPIFYSWPSKQNEIRYKDDGLAIQHSIPMITIFLEDIFKKTDADNVYLVAHSMGNRAMAAAMATLIQDESIRPKVKQLVLTAPDIGADEFESKFAPALAKAGAPITLYASSKDVALKLSKKYNHNRRLGDTNGSVSVIKGIETIDASAVKTDFLGHSYFAESGSVISDIYYLFRTDLRPGQRFNMKGIDSPNGKYWAFQSNLCTP
ncbi:TPA: alpha/beta fold hydrolase [Pseudomonas aeruginosa]|uniref:alpha/beta hydrolase n=1 Tax=Pseudomonas aeruginosa TaxID=287 RepID=UPI00135FF8EF|nr:alpha/beta hydrolase [Pseudomonas aeruginosa]MBG7505884.1 alpha/beta fold hydrolase [Pseudomonas aeruginosa]MWW04602.1 alpha/beta fold hydrolase [Pseudomonas aeruginosa]HCF2637073.1 alpha/beta fold hydrolase [Pseudomonas aeruginosa]HEJ1656676.1 alpha/beta fold hydrolase [Pseudomonas aeruginosa]HEJ3084953.1 alpha/beta fold hydrolase [Pseudomonas aeruginosa]